jgi:hypothetical protein
VLGMHLNVLTSNGTWWCMREKVTNILHLRKKGLTLHEFYISIHVKFIW